MRKIRFIEVGSMLSDSKMKLDNQDMTPKTVAVLGCGVIGRSWAKLFLTHGYTVKIWDPAPDIESQLSIYLGNDLLQRLIISDSSAKAVSGAFFVQESGPESQLKKHALYQCIAPALDKDCIVASSTSTIQPSVLQRDIAFADRVLVGHPFNPPHLLPLVEVIGGELTSPETVNKALVFYRSLNKTAIHLKTERLGHLANRLQAAVWREAVDAVATGQATVEDVDLAMKTSLGPRWSVMGPFETFHLGGGEGGLEHFFDHLGGAFEALWDDAKRPNMTEKLKQEICQELIDSSTNMNNSERIEAIYNKLSKVVQITS